ncbi:MAG: XdhC family protein [Pseudomonadales bacterium]
MLDEQIIFARAAELTAAGTPFAMATVVRTESLSSAKAGSKAIIEADGKIQGWIGGGCSQSAVIKTAKIVLAENKPCLIRVSANKAEVIEQGVTPFVSSCYSGGTLDIFVEPIIAKSRLLILGSSPVAHHLCDLAQRVGFAIFVASTKTTSVKTLGASFLGAEQTFSGFNQQALGAINPNFIIVATQGDGDFTTLQVALESECDYIAFVASRKKADKHKMRLRDKGYSVERVDGILAPAGIPIGASGPAEIALSILADLIAARRGVDVSGLSVRHETATICSNTTVNNTLDTPVNNGTELQGLTSAVEKSCCEQEPQCCGQQSGDGP